MLFLYCFSTDSVVLLCCFCSASVLFQVTRPVHFLVTEKDNAVPVEVARYMASAVPNAKLEVIPLAGHLPHLSHPALVAEVIQRHASM